MEQQNQQPIGQQVPPIQQPSGKSKALIISLVLSLILVILAAVLWGFSKTPTLPEVQNQTTTQATSTAPVGLIKYGSIATPAMKTIPEPNYQGTIQILNVGTFTEGEYKDKNLALALFQFDGKQMYGVNNNYVYYVSDNTGNPIAWDPNFVHDHGIYEMNGETQVYLKDLIGLKGTSQKSLSFLPIEFSSTNKYIQSSDLKSSFLISGTLVSLDVPPSSMSSSGSTETGWQIVKKTNINPNYVSVLPINSYYVNLPFGKLIQIYLEPNFIDANDVPQLTWTSGTKSVASYRYGQYGYGWDDCFQGVSNAQLQSSFIQTGTTVKGDAVYEIDSQKYPKVYQCLHEKTKRYVYDPTTENGTYQDTVTYADFVTSHPIFFWKHSVGDLVAFVRSDVVPAAEKAKPVIYLYPEKTERVSVKVSPLGGFTVTDPEYGNGWIVDATPNSVLTNIKDGKQYPYLFWEGGKEGVVQIPKEGFVISKSDVTSVLNEKLSVFGLNKQERDDFLEFWVPKLSEAPYYFITFVSRPEIDRVSPMTISPKPDSIIRVLMDYKPLTAPISVKPLIITPTLRNGFTVVEWGGILH
jgi:hypothetical protein